MKGEFFALLMSDTMVFSLLFRCSSNTVVTFSTLFNIETISYWPVKKIFSFFVSFRMLIAIIFIFMAQFLCVALEEVKKKKVH